MVVTVGVGRRYEAPLQKGLSHFVEHVVLNGTKSYPTSRQLKDSLESLGGSIGAATSDERTVFDISILQEHLDQALKTLSEIMQYPLFDPKRTVDEKETLRSEVHRLNDNPGSFVGRLITEALWPDQPLASRKDLEEKNFETLKPKDVKKHFSTYYTAPNMVVTIVGDVEHDEWVKKIENSFSSLSKATVPDFPAAKNIVGSKIRSEIRNIKQTKLDLAFYGPDRKNSDRFAVRILRSVIGKRLFYKLREELNLTYDPYSDYIHFEDTGFIEFGGSFKIGNIKKITEAILSEIESVKNGNIEPSELDFAKTRLKSSIILRNESVFALARTYSTRVFNGTEPLLIEDEINIIEKLKSEDLITVAKKYLNTDLKIAAIGPEADIKELESLYGSTS